MSKQSSKQDQVASNEEEFTPAAFIIFCLDNQGEVGLEMSWGNTADEIKKFAILLNKINNGAFSKIILEQLKIQAKEQNNMKSFSIFNKTYKSLGRDLVVDPTNVELA